MKITQVQHPSVNESCDCKVFVSDDYESDQNPHFYSEMEGNVEELPESPSYMQGGYQDQDPYPYGETSASASNSGEFLNLLAGN